MSDRNIWREVDQYFIHMLHLKENHLSSTLRANGEADLPPIDVSPTQGKLLFLLAGEKNSGNRNAWRI